VTARTIAVTEGTIADLAGLRVGVANVWERAYQLPDGSQRTGPTAQLMIDDGSDLVVGDGSEVGIGATRWQVDWVRKSGSEPGEVRFTQIG
jgi:hypothetical protein